MTNKIKSKNDKINIKFYFAIACLILLIISIFYMLKGFLNSIFTSIILTVLVFPVYKYIYKKTNNKRLSASLILISVLFLILIPLTIISGFFLNYIISFELNEDKVELYQNSIHKVTGIEVSITDSLMSLENLIKNEAKQTLPKIVSFTTNFLISTFVIFFVMFYLLVQSQMFKKYTIMLLPFSTESSKQLLSEGNKMIKAVLFGQFFTAVIQGVLGMISFFIAGVSGAFFWGIIMIILSMIPIVGAFLVWLPVGIILILDGSIGMGIFVLLWGALVVSQIDNIVRPILVERFANIHPLETFLGVLAGITIFGFIGIILGPLLLSLFKTFVKIFIKEYGNENFKY